MPSPVLSDSIPTITGSMEACEALRALLESVRQLSGLTGYLFDDTGKPNLSPAREIGAIIFPPGALMEFHIAQGTQYTGIGGVLDQIETKWLSDDEITAYRANRDSVLPFWVVADNNRRSGAPDIAGRFKVGPDFRALDGGNVSGVVGIDPNGGSKDVTLTEEEMPAHTHDLPEPLLNVSISAQQFSGHRQHYGGHEVHNPVTESTGGDQPHNNMPPYAVVVTAYRTSRMV